MEWREKVKPGYYVGVSTQPIGFKVYVPYVTLTVLVVGDPLK